nr:thiamine pyrophosphate-dependent enzyme [Candidatus Methanomethylophilus sp. 1R26]
MSGLSLKELNNIPERLASGHRLCAGCAESIIARQVLMGTEKDVAVSVSTGCFEVSTTIFPYTSWKVPMVHTAFGNGAAACAGLETAYKSLKRQGKTDKDIKFVNFAGDGATYDIGLQSLSGAMERGHEMVYVCFNNEAYMNTGIQRSSATERGASTTTSWNGSVSYGKKEYPKDMTAVMVAHGIPYAAQAPRMPGGTWSPRPTRRSSAEALPSSTPCRPAPGDGGSLPATPSPSPSCPSSAASGPSMRSSTASTRCPPSPGGSPRTPT